MEDTPQTLYSVGRVAEETGLSPDTLRVWERRYGKPVPIRLPSGHRRYTGDQVSFLRRVAEALALGHRPGQLIGRTEAEVDRMIDAVREEPTTSPHIAGWVDFVRRLDGQALRAELERRGSENSTLVFLEEWVTPFLQGIGLAWVEGKLDVRHEHFASETLEDYLRGRRSRAAREVTADRGSFVLVTLPQEKHGLGLQMTALLCQEAGIRTHLVGTDTPVPEILRAAADSRADAVALSVSLAGAGVQTDRTVASLRKQLPETVRLAVGGEGIRRVRRKRRDIDWFETLSEFQRWLVSAPWLGEHRA